jgi:hypothetical protein
MAAILLRLRGFAAGRRPLSAEEVEVRLSGPLGASASGEVAVEGEGLGVVGVDPLLTEKAPQQAGLILGVDFEPRPPRISHRPPPAKRNGRGRSQGLSRGIAMRKAARRRLRFPPAPQPASAAPSSSRPPPQTGATLVPARDPSWAHGRELDGGHLDAACHPIGQAAPLHRGAGPGKDPPRRLRAGVEGRHAPCSDLRQ